MSVVNFDFSKVESERLEKNIAYSPLVGFYRIRFQSLKYSKGFYHFAIDSQGLKLNFVNLKVIFERYLPSQAYDGLASQLLSVLKVNNSTSSSLGSETSFIIDVLNYSSFSVENFNASDPKLETLENGQSINSCTLTEHFIMR